MKRKATWAALAVLAIAAGVALPRAFETTAPSSAQAQTKTQTHGAGPQTVPVTAGTVVEADMPVVLEAIGTVQPANMVTVKSRVDGQIVAADFKEGQNVKAGTVLFQIDPRPYEAALAQAEATKQKDEAQLATAQADFARASQLVARGYQSQQTYDQAKAQVAQLQASIKGDEAQIATAQLNLSYATIKAPIDGRLGARLVDVGNMVRASEGAALVTIAQVRPIDVVYGSPGEPAQGAREAGAGAAGRTGDRRGRQDAALDGQADADRQPDRPDHRHAEAEGELRQRGRAPMAGPVHQCAAGPQYAPGRLDRASADRAGRAERPLRLCHQGRQHRRAASVEVAAVQDGVAVIGKGLSLGEKIVVDGQYRLTNGSRVRPAPPKSDGKSDKKSEAAG